MARFIVLNKLQILLHFKTSNCNSPTLNSPKFYFNKFRAYTNDLNQILPDF